MHWVAAFCSQKAWSVSISSRDIDARSTHLGSVGIFKPSIELSEVLMKNYEGAKIKKDRTGRSFCNLKLFYLSYNTNVNRVHALSSLL